MHRFRRSFVVCSSIAVLSLAAGCAASEEVSKEAATSRPHLLALSSYSASLGTPIDAVIANPPPQDAKNIELVFQGTFTRSDGRVEPVNVAQATTRTEAGAVRWTSFGPFANPFTPTAPDVGVFSGKAGIRVTNADGSVTDDESPIPVRFEVKPSIILTELQPITADCGKPALRLIGNMAYKMKAETLGFKATSIEYSFRTPGIVPDLAGKPVFDLDSEGAPKYETRKITHAMTSQADVIDEKEALVLPPVPQGVPSYGVVFVITARDDAGRKVSAAFGMTAHNPIDIYYDGRFQLAQIYPATLVSACYPGGQQGRSVGYSESTTETRQRQVSLTVSSNWMQGEENNWSTSDGKTFTTSKTVTDGYSTSKSNSNTFSFSRSGSTTNGVSFNWSDSNTNSSGWQAGGEAGVNIKGVFNVGGNGNYHRDKAHTSGTGGGTSSSSTAGWEQGQSNTTTNTETRDHSTATTDSESVTKTETTGGNKRTEEGGGEALTDSWTVSSAETIQRGFNGQVIANTYGVFYRQMARYTRRAFVLTYDKCGESEVIGDLTMQDYVWAPDLALGEACTPLPATNFPAPQCFLPPCEQK